ncbi:hypothetical protein G9A89_011070 [Geosiphon pyriformis]|nr:hypothetical protein G9A89_011070 [Geosiphon pyriformis]
MSYKTNQSSQSFFKVSSITEPMTKIRDCIVILFKTEKLSPCKMSKVLHADEILSKRILEKILRVVSIKAIGQVFVKTLSYLYSLRIIETQAFFQVLSTDSRIKQEFKSTKSIFKIDLSQCFQSSFKIPEKPAALLLGRLETILSNSLKLIGHITSEKAPSKTCFKGQYCCN